MAKGGYRHTARRLSVASITSRWCNQRRVIFIFGIARRKQTDRPGINSTGQVLQFPRKRDNAGRDASLQRGVIVVPSKWTVYRWIGRFLLETRPRVLLVNGMHRDAFSSFSFSLSLFNSSPLTLSAYSVSDAPLKMMYRVNCNGVK